MFAFFPHGYGLYLGTVGVREVGAKTGGYIGGGASQLTFSFRARRVEVRMSENSCRSERQEKGRSWNGHFP